MADDERKKMKQLLKEKQTTRSSVDWMYKGEKPDEEEYLLGRRLDRHVEKEEEKPKEDDIGALFGERIKANIAMDMKAKMREDPLFAIRKREEEAKRRLLENPMKMKQLQKMIAQKKDKGAHKRKKSKKKKHKHHKKSESDSDSQGDDLVSKYLSILKSKNKKGVRKGESKTRDRQIREDNFTSNKRDKESRDNSRPDRDSKPRYRPSSGSDRRVSDKGGNKGRKSSQDSSSDSRENHQYKYPRHDAADRDRQSKFARKRHDSSDSSGDRRDSHRQFHRREGSSSRDGRLDPTNKNGHLEISSYKDRQKNNKKRRHSRSESDSDTRTSENRKQKVARNSSHPVHRGGRSRGNYGTDSRDRRNKYLGKSSRHDTDSDSDNLSSCRSPNRCKRSPVRRETSPGRRNSKHYDTKRGYNSRSRRHDTDSSESDDKSSSRSSVRRKGTLLERESSSGRKNKCYDKKLSNSISRRRHDSDSVSEDSLKKKQTRTDSLRRRKSSSEESSSSSDSEGDTVQTSRPAKSYGLVKMGSPPKPKSESLSKPAREILEKIRKKQKSVSPEPQREPKRKLTTEEKQRRLQEMMENATWREEQRNQNIKRYQDEHRKEEEEERKSRGKSNFLGSMMSDHADSSTVEDRLKRNKYNIQRTNAALDRNFTKQ